MNKDLYEPLIRVNKDHWIGYLLFSSLFCKYITNVFYFRFSIMQHCKMHLRNCLVLINKYKSAFFIECVRWQNRLQNLMLMISTPAKDKEYIYTTKENLLPFLSTFQKQCVQLKQLIKMPKNGIKKKKQLKSYFNLPTC